MKLDVTHSQEGFEKYCLDYFEWARAKQQGTVNILFDPQVAGCSYAEMWMQVDLRVDDWMQNPLGNMHGGMISAALDMTMGLVTRYASGGRMTPTIDLTVHYLRSIPVGSVLHVKARCMGMNDQLCHAVARCWTGDDEERPNAIASGSYFRAEHDTVAQ